MAGGGRQIPPSRPPTCMTTKHVLELYGVYIHTMTAPPDPRGSQRPSRPDERQVLHRVIHRRWIARTAMTRRFERAARLAARDARALEWRVRRHAERPAKCALAAHCMSAAGTAGTSFFASLSTVRRTALMLTPRIAHGALTPPRRPRPASGARLVRATCS